MAANTDSLRANVLDNADGETPMLRRLYNDPHRHTFEAPLNPHNRPNTQADFTLLIGEAVGKSGICLKVIHNKVSQPYVRIQSHKTLDDYYSKPKRGSCYVGFAFRDDDRRHRAELMDDGAVRIPGNSSRRFVKEISAQLNEGRAVEIILSLEHGDSARYVSFLVGAGPDSVGRLVHHRHSDPSAPDGEHHGKLA